MRRVGTIAHVVMMALFMSGAAAQTASVPEARLKAIYAMTPQQMAETGQWTKQAYDRMLGYINNIQDKDIRELVLDMVLRPESKVFKAKATQSFLASPAAGGKGHHYYPGGLPVHVLEWIDVSMAWADAYEKIYKVKKVTATSSWLP